MTTPSLPRVSIVTPSFNQAQYIESTIQSVLVQDYPQIEYLIVDGSSTDNTVDIIKKYQGQLAWWVSEKDQGQTDAINKGFARASGDILAWINSDDTYEPGAVRLAANYLMEHPEVGMVYGDCNFINAEGRVIGRFASAQTNYRLLRQGYVHIPQQAAFWRAELWRQVGPLDPSLTFAMDYDLWVRLSKISKLQYLPRLWAEFRLHADSKTLQNDMRAWEDMLKVHRREDGGSFSIIVAKYWLRRLLFPVIRYRRRKMARAPLN